MLTKARDGVVIDDDLDSSLLARLERHDREAEQHGSTRQDAGDERPTVELDDLLPAPVSRVGQGRVDGRS